MRIVIFPNLPIDPLLQDVFLVALIILIGIAVILPLLRYNHELKHQETLSKIYSYRIYTINLNLNKVVYFDKTNPKDLRTISIEQFLRQYDAEDYYRVQTWLESLIKEKQAVSWHLEARAHIKSSRKTFFSVLEVTKIDSAAKIIHLNSYLLRYLSPKRGKSLRHKSNVVTIDEGNRLLEKSASNRGAMYLIRFFYRKHQGNTGNYISAVFLKNLKDKITNFLSLGLYLVEQDGAEIILLETKNLSPNEHRQIAHSIAHAIDRNLEISGLKDEVAFTIGVVEHKFFPRHFDDLLHHARIMADRAEKESILVDIYDQNQSYSEVSAKAVDLEIIDIIKSRKYEIQFRPILNLKKYEVNGFICKIIINSSIANNRHDLCRIADDSESCRELLSNLARQMLSSFTSGRQDVTQMLLFPASIYESNFILKSLAMMKKAKESTIVLVFDETEINDSEMNEQQISQLINSFKEKGLQTALSFADMHLLLTKEIYNLFDYYLLDRRMTYDIITNDRQRIEVHSLIETLRQFNHPIIASDMFDLEGVEILANFEVDNMSADCIAPYRSELGAIDSKVLNRTRQFEIIKKN